MKVWIILFAGVFIINLTASEAFAPKVQIPKNMKDRSVWEPVIKGWKVPSKAEVGLPAFPEAFVVGLKAKSAMTANGVKYNTLPMIVLITKVEQKKVVAFYKEKLKSWHYKNDFGMFDVFWTGAKKFNSMDIRQSATQPNVSIIKAGIPYTDYMPEGKTTITIVYKTKKQ